MFGAASVDLNSPRTESRVPYIGWAYRIVITRSFGLRGQKKNSVGKDCAFEINTARLVASGVSKWHTQPVGKNPSFMEIHGLTHQVSFRLSNNIIATTKIDVNDGLLRPAVRRSGKLPETVQCMLGALSGQFCFHRDFRKTGRCKTHRFLPSAY